MSFNSYVVFDNEGDLIAHSRTGLSGAKTDPVSYFEGLAPDVQSRASVMLVLQETGFVARYVVTQSETPLPTLGPREGLTAWRKGE